MTTNHDAQKWTLILDEILDMGMTQAGVAKFVNVTPNAIWLIKQGRTKAPSYKVGKGLTSLRDSLRSCKESLSL